MCLFFHFTFHLTTLFGSSAGVCFQFEKPWSSAHDMLFGILQTVYFEFNGEKQHLLSQSWKSKLDPLLLCSASIFQTGKHRDWAEVWSGHSNWEDTVSPVGIKSHLELFMATFIQSNSTNHKARSIEIVYFFFYIKQRISVIYNSQSVLLR